MKPGKERPQPRPAPIRLGGGLGLPVLLNPCEMERDPKARPRYGWIVGLLLGFLWSASAAVAADVCRDAKGKFTACPETLIEPQVVPEPGPKDCTVTGCPTHGEECVQLTKNPPLYACVKIQEQKRQPLSIRAYAGGVAAVATDADAAVEPLASLQVLAPLTTSPKGPSLHVRADLVPLAGDVVGFDSVETFKAIELGVGIVQPLGGPLLFSLYAEGGFASRLAVESEPVDRLPGWASFGLIFSTADRDHSLRVGMGPDQRLSGEWSPCVHVSGQAKVGEKAGVSLYLVGSLIRALDLQAYGYSTPSRDSIRLGIAVGM